jgi:hypothetical protein
MAPRDQPFDDRDLPFGTTTACSSNRAQASRVNANSASNAAIRRRAAASSSASTLGTPARIPASMSTCSFQRNKVAAEIPVSAATVATGSPERNRTQIWRRTDPGYDFGTVILPRSLCLNSHKSGSSTGDHITWINQQGSGQANPGAISDLRLDPLLGPLPLSQRLLSAVEHRHWWPRETMGPRALT